MKHRAPAAVAVAFLILRAVSAPAQTLGTVAAPRLSGTAPIPTPLAVFAPARGLVLPAFTGLTLSPALAAPSAAPFPAAVQPAFFMRPALSSAKALLGEITAAEGRRDAAGALSAAFDGLKSASVDDGISAAEPAPTPESFALQAQRLFTEIRRVEAERGARPEGAVATDDELRGRMESLPATNPEREKFMIALFKLAGAKESDIVLQDAGRGRRNIMVVKKGRTDRVIVVGGHHDKVSAGRGTIDNGTGSTLVANLYQALHDVETDATIVFIAFAREEEGLIGSQQYVRSLTQEQRGKVDAMINLDTLAVDGTFSWRNNSTRALLDRLAEVSRESGHALKEDYLNGGDADSSTFRDAGIPAVTLYGASQDVIFDVIHTERDNMAAFDLGHYKNAYLLTLETLKSLDRRPLGPIARGDI